MDCGRSPCGIHTGGCAFADCPLFPRDRINQHVGNPDPTGDIAIGAMHTEIVRLRRLIMDQGIKIGVLLAALSEIDDLAVSHTKGAIGKAQKIARKALTAGTTTQSVSS